MEAPIKITMPQWLFICSQLPTPEQWFSKSGPHAQFIVPIPVVGGKEVSDYTSSQIPDTLMVDTKVLRFKIGRDNVMLTWSPVHSIEIVPNGIF